MSDFIRQIVAVDSAANTFERPIQTRFPPEPNGHLHIGHAKSICLNFGISKEFPGAHCNLRLDDTNPSTEEEAYVTGIKKDVRWLGFEWGEREYHASDYFDVFFEMACRLIRKGRAYVCSLSPEQMREMRGTLTSPGTDSPHRERTPSENLQPFEQMRDGKFTEGEHVLRAKIDMASPNLNLRDPSIYRIRREPHHRTGNKWCIYPMYDFAHCISDAIEGVTHSLCTLEFEAHRPLYDWFLSELEFNKPPRQIEFARLNLTHTVLSKRKLNRLVEDGIDWDDPRMPTLSGLRRRGFTPESIRDFCDKIGVSKAENTVEVALLHFCLREHLNKVAPRRMAVLRPVKLVIENYPDGQVEELEAENNPEDQSFGSRKIPFSRELYVEAEDYQPNAPKDWFRLAPGKEVRLKHAYYVKCVDAKFDGETLQEIICTYDPKTHGGWSDDGRKIKGTLHWVSAPHAIRAEIRVYDTLFTDEHPNENSVINPSSFIRLENSFIEPALTEACPGDHFQFLRQGYFVADNKDFSAKRPVFNLATTLKDTWARIQRNS